MSAYRTYVNIIKDEEEQDFEVHVSYEAGIRFATWEGALAAAKDLAEKRGLPLKFWIKKVVEVTEEEME